MSMNYGSHAGSRFFSPAHRKESLVSEIKKMVAQIVWKSGTGRGALEQERFFMGHVQSPEHSMVHMTLADDDLGAMQEGTGTATTDGGSPDAPVTLTG